jgi:hypothetical protein
VHSLICNLPPNNSRILEKRLFEQKKTQNKEENTIQTDSPQDQTSDNTEPKWNYLQNLGSDFFLRGIRS